jgi:hypothetical protein
MDADKNKKLRRTAIAARLPRDKLPSVIIGFVQGAETAARDRASEAMARRSAAHRNQTPTTARKMRRLPDDE